ncbi:MAG: trmFO [Oscillospiraceae bacterium]|jgi:methylenetetrahydrofolate--tRNA-(uracil-5-)-methyltransferase|nr:trmFO [Oscillospiraceae bacterium]
MKVSVIGAGLAGCEAAWQLANNGVQVDLYEQKPKKHSPAHSYDGFAELVCSNSLKAERIDSAAGLLKHEMELLGSIIVECAKKTAVAAGGALAVDREKFSDLVTQKIKSHSNINIIHEELTRISSGYCIIATGPLTSDAFAASIKELLGVEYLSFFDAAAPIVTAESIDFDKAFFASRYGKGDDDYINCPMDKEEYELFYNQLINAEIAPLKEFDKASMKVYEGCMPVEVMAKRGQDTLRFGPLKPVGLTDPKTGKRPWAVVQLRKENAEGTLYNLVGFQTNLKFGEQKRVFSLIPGLEGSEIVRYGVMHRNTFIDSPRLLDNSFNLKKEKRIYFAGQITGVEGYIESAASGILAGKNLSRILLGKEPIVLPRDTMLGALSHYISDETVQNFQPMGCNMGILPSLPERIKDKKLRYQTIASRGIDSLKECLVQYE